MKLRKPAQCAGVLAMVALCAFSWAVVGVESIGAATPHAVAERQTQVAAPTGLTTGQKGVTVVRHKEGGLAIALSILGVVLVAAFIVGWSSLSVRRRSRDGPSRAQGEQAAPWWRPFG